jgi:hypothetical protein
MSMEHFLGTDVKLLIGNVIFQFKCPVMSDIDEHYRHYRGHHEFAFVNGDKEVSMSRQRLFLRIADLRLHMQASLKVVHLRL